MKIKRLEINGFRCLQNLSIVFEDDLTVLVGENDCGKSSLIDCLKVITQNKSVEADDFNSVTNTIKLSIEIENFVFDKVYKKDGETVLMSSFVAKPSPDFLNVNKGLFEADEFEISNPECAEKIKAVARLFGIIVRANSNIENLKQSVLEKINEYLANPDLKIENAQFPRFNNIQLDGKQFENVSSFFKEVFLKEKQSDIWKEKINEETTIEEFIKEKIDSYSDDVSKRMNERGIKDKIRLFLNKLTDIRVEPIYQTKDVNIDAKVKFLENGEEINLQKKGDGTKRRITMALLEFKKDEDILNDDETTIYLLDEPDTHLHVRAQIELLETLQGFASNGNQVILTTHSPFIINSVAPDQIRLLDADERNGTKVKHLHIQSSTSAKILQSVGIENVYLFFAKTILIVEGKTEEEFISNYFQRKTERSINSNLIKIINVEGIQNIYGFAKGILELHNPENIYVVFDNDASDELKELIDQLKICAGRKFVIGNKEFEDAFSDEVLYCCWKKFNEYHDKVCPENWSIENIKCLREDCDGDKSLKFSQKLKALGASGKKMTKPIFGAALAQFIDEKDLPPKMTELFKNLL
ncbi:MAG TPA: AAA family ATPase [Anaerolineales bacterium]|jgi:predicted ATP-dependent endonuclease of OLD family